MARENNTMIVNTINELDRTAITCYSADSNRYLIATKKHKFVAELYLVNCKVHESPSGEIEDYYTIELAYQHAQRQLDVIPNQISCWNDEIYVTAKVIAPDFCETGSDGKNAENMGIVEWGEMCESLPKVVLFHIRQVDSYLELIDVRTDITAVFPLGDILFATQGEKLGFQVVDKDLNCISQATLGDVRARIAFHQIAIVGNVLFLIQRRNTIDYFDISNLNSPKHLGSLLAKEHDIRGLKNAPITQVLHYKDFIVINYQAGSGGATLIDVFDPSHPRLIEEKSWPYNNKAESHFSMAYEVDDQLLVCVQSYGIRWMDISTTNNKMVAKMNLYELGTIQEAVFNYPYVHVQFFRYPEESGGIATINISDPFRPRIERMLHSGDGAHPEHNEEMYHSLEAAFDDPKKVRHLDLSRYELTDIPDEVFLLAHLESFNLAHNQIEVLTDKISLLEELKSLNLFNNRVLNQLPLSLLEMNQLQVVQLAKNKLENTDDKFKQQAWFVD
jgi:hypothetical protein